MNYEDIRYDGVEDPYERYKIYLKRFCYHLNISEEDAEKLLMVKLVKEEILNGNK